MKAKLLVGLGFPLILGVIFMLAGGASQTVHAAQPPQDTPGVRGAMLYDNWFATLNVAAPSGNMPLWDTQTTNTRSGEDTWRCVTCHGWDYLGKDGANGSGSNYTGFPGLARAKEMSVAEITAALTGETNPQHDFSNYLSEDDLSDLAEFMQVAESGYVNLITLKVEGGDLDAGKQLYDEQCASCHGADGALLKFRFEGRDATLGTLALLDPWRFLHKTQYGTPGTDMVVGAHIGSTLENGRDILLYAQSLPSGMEIEEVQPPLAGEEMEEPEALGGPASDVVTGIATALGAMFTSLGFAILLGAFLVGVIFLVVWLVRDRKSK